MHQGFLQFHRKRGVRRVEEERECTVSWYWHDLVKEVRGYSVSRGTKKVCDLSPGKKMVGRVAVRGSLFQWDWFCV